MTKAELDEALIRMISAYGDPHGYQLSGRALSPWMRKWAKENQVEVVDSPDTELGMVYLTRIRPSDD